MTRTQSTPATMSLGLTVPTRPAVRGRLPDRRRNHRRDVAVPGHPHPLRGLRGVLWGALATRGVALPPRRQLGHAAWRASSRRACSSSGATGACRTGCPRLGRADRRAEPGRHIGDHDDLPRPSPIPLGRRGSRPGDGVGRPRVRALAGRRPPPRAGHRRGDRGHARAVGRWHPSGPPLRRDGPDADHRGRGDGVDPVRRRDRDRLAHARDGTAAGRRPVRSAGSNTDSADRGQERTARTTRPASDSATSGSR